MKKLHICFFIGLLVCGTRSACGVDYAYQCQPYVSNIASVGLRAEALNLTDWMIRSSNNTPTILGAAACALEGSRSAGDYLDAAHSSLNTNHYDITMLAHCWCVRLTQYNGRIGGQYYVYLKEFDSSNPCHLNCASACASAISGGNSAIKSALFL